MLQLFNKIVLHRFNQKNKIYYHRYIYFKNESDQYMIMMILLTLFYRVYIKVIRCGFIMVSNETTIYQSKMT